MLTLDVCGVMESSGSEKRDVSPPRIVSGPARKANGLDLDSSEADYACTWYAHVVYRIHVPVLHVLTAGFSGDTEFRSDFIFAFPFSGGLQPQ